MSATTDAERSRLPAAPYLLSAPALLLYVVLLLVPLVATALLSLHSFGIYKGIENVYNLANYRDIFGDSYFYEIFGRTFRIAFLVTLLAAAIGAPEAYILNRMRAPWRGIFLLVALGIIAEPLQFMYSETGVIIALTHVLIPLMVISVWASLQRLDPQIENAAISLGAAAPTVLRRIVLPQAMPGILSGGIIVFALAASAFATPAIIGGRRLKVAATLAYDEFLNTLNWPLGAAIAILLLIANIVIIVGCNRLLERRYAEVFR